MAFYHLDTVEKKNILAGYGIKFIHGENVSMVYLDIEPNAVLPEHSHVHEQFSTVLQGRFEMTVGDETQVLEPGGVAHIPPNVPHSGRALSHCWMIETFYPVKAEKLD